MPLLGFILYIFSHKYKKIFIVVTLLSYHCCIHIVSYIDVMFSKTACADPESFARRGPTFFIKGKRIQRALKAGHYRPASDTPFKWSFTDGADDGPTLNAGLAAL